MHHSLSSSIRNNTPLSPTSSTVTTIHHTLRDGPNRQARHTPRLLHHGPERCTHGLYRACIARLAHHRARLAMLAALGLVAMHRRPRRPPGPVRAAIVARV